MTFQPVPAQFAPSQQRGRDIAIYPLPEDRTLCYEWSFRHLFTDRVTKTYICCGCRALKDALPQTYTQPIPSCHIRGDQFITDPANPARPHYCVPRSTPRAVMRRIVIGKCNELRGSHERRPTSVVVQELVQEVASPSYSHYPAPERRAMIEQLTCPSQRGAENLSRTLRRNIRRGQQLAVPGALNPALCRCSADDEQFILHDANGVIYLASRMLWNEAFNTLNLRAVGVRNFILTLRLS
ncbi:hypothetical protein Q1695_005402 [Nippostrongylus brasiliensis]|nr:hypothetical protein Q1695_005402 [Nippostrongylus brasiliensis]